MSLLVEGQHHVAVALAFPGDLGESVGAEPPGGHQRLEMVLDGDARQPGQYSRRDRIGRDPENRPSLVVDSLIEFEGHLAGADGGDKEQPGRGIPTDLVDQGLTAGDDLGGVPQAGGMELGRSGKGKQPHGHQDRCGDSEASPHISPMVGNVGSQSTKGREGQKISTKGHEERRRATKKNSKKNEPFAKFVVGRSLFGSRVFPPESLKDPVTLNRFAV